MLEDIIDQKQLLNNFINMKSISNIGVMKCYKLLLSKKGIVYNLGSYILSSIIIINIIYCICFIINGYKSIYNMISNIVIIKKENIKTNNFLKDGNNGNTLKINKKNKIKKEDALSDDHILKDKIKFNEDRFQIKSINHLINLSQNIIKNESSEIKMYNFPKNLDYTTKYDDDFEINSLSYEKALEKDKRSFIQYYISLLKTNHLLIFTFKTNSDYNSRIIKICLFFFSFSLNLCVNSLFFNDSTMHKLYENKGVFDFIYFIPIILYSNIICIIINIIIKNLALSQKNIVKFKSLNNYDECKQQFGKLRKCLLIKFILFFILNFVFLSLFWYYVSCFCAVYKNTQINLIKETLISFGMILLYPFIICLITAYIRITLLKKPETFLGFFFKISKLFD